MRNFSDVVSKLLGIIDLIVPLLFGLTLLFIVWGVVDAWIIHGGDEGRVEEGKNTIVIGVISLVVMSGIWGILSILKYSLF
jgi:hypothetical protein